MKAFLLTFIVSLRVGVLYAGMWARSPAPALVALAGLLGMVLGEAAWQRAMAATGSVGE